eukprot:1938846-Rhodomonas_salina.2
MPLYEVASPPSTRLPRARSFKFKFFPAIAGTNNRYIGLAPGKSTTENLPGYSDYPCLHPY